MSYLNFSLCLIWILLFVLSECFTLSYLNTPLYLIWMFHSVLSEYSSLSYLNVSPCLIWIILFVLSEYFTLFYLNTPLCLIWMFACVYCPTHGSISQIYMQTATRNAEHWNKYKNIYIFTSKKNFNTCKLIRKGAMDIG